MDALECIKTRRSVRKYQDKKLPEDHIRTILEAAMHAPSAGNEQPWHFIVVNEKKVLLEIAKINPYAGMAKDAEAAILVCGDLTLEKFGGFWVEDCSAATENILLAAHALGLGAVWTGGFPMKDRVEGYRRLFKLPDHIIPLALIPLGYPESPPKKEYRFSQSKIHYNEW